MSKYTRAWLAFFITLAMVYLVGAFVQADLNVSHWPQSLRITFAVIGVIGSVCVKQITINGKGRE